MSGRLRLLAPLLAAVATGLLGAPGAPAATAVPLEPLDVRVVGGEGAWHPEARFSVSWSRAVTSNGPPYPAAIDYVVRAGNGVVVVPRTQIPWEGDRIAHLDLPPAPGRYAVELWLEAEGTEGPHASAQLLFDPTRPGPPRLQAPPWIGRGADPVLLVARPAGPEPPSGIAGYAVSVDRGGDSAPCAGEERCAAAELDAGAAAGAEAIHLGALPEGVDVARVVAVSGSGMRSGSTATALLHVDLTRPDVALGGAPAGWSNTPVRLTASAADGLSGMAAAGPNGPITAIVVDGRAAAASPGPRSAATVSGDGVHRVSFHARDAAGNVSDEGAAVVRIDEAPPAVAFAREQDPAEPERILATVADGLSGPALRGSIAVRPADSNQRFTALPTTAAAGTLTAAWDSDAFPAGSYEFRATGYDRAGNSTSTNRRADGARMVLSNPLKTAARLHFGFGGRRLVWQRCRRVAGGRRCRRHVTRSFDGRPAARSASYGHGIVVGGRLTTATGSPLTGQPVALVESFDAGSSQGPRTTVVETRGDGSFTTRLAPGPSRRVAAVFAGNRVLCRTSARPIRLGVLASVRLRASSTRAQIGGSPVVFSGRVGGRDARLPATGRPVQLQFRLPGAGWSEFRTVQTDAHGRFRYAYAFADDDSRGVRFQFRAYAPAAEGWPYEAGASRPVFVTGS